MVKKDSARSHSHDADMGRWLMHPGFMRLAGSVGFIHYFVISAVGMTLGNDGVMWSDFEYRVCMAENSMRPGSLASHFDSLILELIKGILYEL